MKTGKMKYFPFIIFVTLLLVTGLAPRDSVSAQPPTNITSPSQLIDAVNNLRLTYGLAPLPIHPILMQTAQSQADYMAATGNITHARPGGMTYTQQLLSLGFPLAGDLSLGGFRSENILSSYGPLVWNGVPDGWQDAQHMNTMLSGNFTHIGAGISQSGDSYYYAVDTAAVTSSGQQQESASTIMTSVPSGANESAGASQFMVPVTVSTPRPDGTVIHKVQYGQSLWSIAIAYGTTIKSIQALNNMGADSTVYQGQELFVMTGATQAAALPSTVTAQPTFTPAPATESSATPAPTLTALPPTDIEEENSSSPGFGSSKVLVVVIIIAAFVGAGMAVWLIREPE